MKDTAAIGSLSLILSRIAEPKARHPMVRQFAHLEIAEQEIVGNILMSMKMPDAPLTGNIKPLTESELIANVDPTGRTIIEMMRVTEAGSEFDRAYIRAEIEGHRKLLVVQNTYLGKPDDADVTNVAKLARGYINEHLTLLGDIEKAG